MDCLEMSQHKLYHQFHKKDLKAREPSSTSNVLHPAPGRSSVYCNSWTRALALASLFPVRLCLTQYEVGYRESKYFLLLADYSAAPLLLYQANLEKKKKLADEMR